MNFQDVLHYMFLHSEMLIGIFTALLLFTVIFVLVLPSHDKQNASDLSAIEESLKKVIDQIPKASFAAGAVKKTSGVQDEEELAYPSSNQEPDVVAAAPVVTEADKAEALEREKKIKSLEGELAQAKAQLLKAPPPGEVAIDPATAQKITELQNKLSEYAIIEEELADISRYKDENANMRAQLEALQGGAAAPAPVSNAVAAPVAESVAPSVESPVAAAVAPEPIIEAKADAIISEDQVLNDFEAAVNHQAIPKAAIAGEVLTSIPIGEVPEIAASESNEISMAEPPDPVLETTEPATQEALSSDSPLEGALDTSKMLQEMETLVEQPEVDETDPMAGLLDTEKLLAEVRELGGPKSATPAQASAVDQTEVDDLMSEFEAEQKQIKVKA